mmetsp:Transcript_27570/g.63887  ORF Transcript_27570/g.63887 Transcript_27570/m.63887 type:complete len:88 (-) Transcript_27570:82-345(-)
MHAIATSLGRKDQRTKQQRKRDKRKDEKIAKLPSETRADDADPSLTMGKMYSNQPEQEGLCILGGSDSGFIHWLNKEERIMAFCLVN